MTGATHFIEPLDVLHLRGNRLFGGPGSHGELVLPPWPSVAAGALRTALLAHRGIDPVRFARGLHACDPELGTPDCPGSFEVKAFHMARRRPGDPSGAAPLFQVPADMVVGKEDNGTVEAGTLIPRAVHEDIRSSCATPLLAVLAETGRGKPLRDYWVTAEGWKRYLDAKPLDPEKHLVESASLWSTETRIGVGLDARRRRAADGQLFSMETVAFRKAEHNGSAPRTGKQDGSHRTPQDESGFNVGFLVELGGVDFPESATLRFGGDGRGASCRRVASDFPEPDYDRIAAEGRCRLVLTTPGIFDRGWLPAGAAGPGREPRFDLHGVRGQIVCAAVGRPETVSGFDMARGMPKAARRVAPTGSVYWLDDLETTAGALRNLVARGLWADPCEDDRRRAEGFNRLAVAAWKKEQHDV